MWHACEPTTPPPRIDDLRGIHAGHAAQQHAEPAVRLLEVVRAGLHGHPARDLRHRRQQRQSPRGRRHGLVGDADGAARDEILRLVRIGREMQVGEQDLPVAQHLALDRLRLLHLDDHVGGGEHLGRGSGDFRARLAVRVVVHSDALTGVVLDDHLVAVRHRFAHAARHEADAIFENLDFLGDADAHGICSGLGAGQRRLAAAFAADRYSKGSSIGASWHTRRSRGCTISVSIPHFFAARRRIRLPHRSIRRP